jgi:hypothetical protein
LESPTSLLKEKTGLDLVLEIYLNIDLLRLVVRNAFRDETSLEVRLSELCAQYIIDQWEIPEDFDAANMQAKGLAPLPEHWTKEKK